MVRALLSGYMRVLPIVSIKTFNTITYTNFENKQKIDHNHLEVNLK